MLKALVNAGEYTSGNIPCTIYKNTNNKYALADDGFKIAVDGLTEVKVNIMATASANGSLGLQMYADGVAIAGANSTQTVANGSEYAFHINDIVKTVPTFANQFVTLTFAFSSACTIQDGDIILAYER